MKQANKSVGVWSIVGITTVLLAILNVLSFAIPFPSIDDAVFYSAYGLCEFIYIVSAALLIVQIMSGTSKNDKVMGIPVAYSTLIMALVQTILTIIFYIVNAFVLMPVWILAIVEVVILSIFIIQIVIKLFFKYKNVEYHEKLADTNMMDEFKARVKTLSEIAKSDNVANLVQDLYDNARASDPVSNDKTLQTEEEMLSKLYQLDIAIKNSNEEDSTKLVSELQDLLIERNSFCKAGKIK